MKKIKWIIIVYLVINVILALIPDLHGEIQGITANWDDTLGILFGFFFNPIEYVWKWIVALLVVVITLISR